MALCRRAVAFLIRFAARRREQVGGAVLGLLDDRVGRLLHEGALFRRRRETQAQDDFAGRRPDAQRELPGRGCGARSDSSVATSPAPAVLACIAQYGHNGHMRKTSLAHAKAHLSELVDDVEHRGKRIVIQRHGKPAAALVPVDLAVPKRKPARMSVAAAQSLFAELAKYDDPHVSAVEDLLQSRR